MLAAEPTNAECYNLMGSINDAEGNRDAAIENFKKCGILYKEVTQYEYYTRH